MVSMRGASLPSIGSRQARFPDVVGTTKALRLPAPPPRSLIGFARGYHAYLLCSLSPQRSRAAGGSARAWTFVQPVVPSPAPRRVDDCRISQVPWRSIPCLCPAPGPRSDQRHLAIRSVAPVLPPRRGLRRLRRSERFRGLPPGFGTCCLRFKSTHCGCPGKTRFRPAGSRLYRVGVEPTGPLRKVSGHSHGLPPSQGLPWRYLAVLGMTAWTMATTWALFERSAL